MDSNYVSIEEMQAIASLCDGFQALWEKALAIKSVSLDEDTVFGGVKVFDSNGELLGTIGLTDDGFGLYFPTEE